MKYQKGNTLVELLAIMYIAGFIGYVLNIIELYHLRAIKVDEITFFIILRVMGVFAFPIGSVLGFL